MNEARERILSYAQSFDKVTTVILMLSLEEATKSHSLRYRIAARLQQQIFSLARSIVKLTLISTKVDLQAVRENAQSIIALTRILTESCAKFFYLTIDPSNKTELERRFAYYSLVGARKLKQLHLTAGANNESIVSIDKIIAGNQKRWLKSDPYNWAPFLALSSKEKKKIISGNTQEDCLTNHFREAINRRLNAAEKLHYQLLGNVAVHSSSFLLYTHEPIAGDEPSFLEGVTSFALFNAARHLALHGLETLARFPVIKNQLTTADGADLTQLARGIKQDAYLYA
jgi:hypothetical protein